MPLWLDQTVFLARISLKAQKIIEDRTPSCVRKAITIVERLNRQGRSCITACPAVMDNDNVL